MRAFALAVLALTLVMQAAGAAELVMYRSPGCPWCAMWDREVGPVYAKTEAGRRAPLRMADLDAAQDSGVMLQRPVRYSPTFALVDNGHEIGRIEGYPGEDFFWGLLEQLVLKLPAVPQTSTASR
jgi:thioredoxin-related protein